MIRPPTMVIPSGRRSSDPVPVPSASGKAPKSAAIVVIRIGRKRSMHASKIASRRVILPSRSASRAKSIIMIAFFFTMPISSTMPMIEMMFRSFLEDHQCQHGTDARRGQGRYDRERMHQALVQDSKNNVYRQQRR